MKKVIEQSQNEIDQCKNELKQAIQNHNAENIIDILLQRIAELTVVNERFNSSINVLEEKIKAIDVVLHDEDDLQQHNEFRREFELDARMPLDDAYFYPLEYADDGCPIRWTGLKNEIKINLSIDRSQDVVLELYTYGAITDEHLSNAYLFVEGGSTQLDYKEGVLSCIIPKSHSPRTLLRLKFPDAVSPYELNGSEDKRPLAIAFKSLTLRQLENKSSDAPVSAEAV